jgi:DNA repair exonuclease SbcCD nuclease subunit
VSKFIHTADWQIGMKFNGLKPSSRDQMKSDRFEVINQIASVCNNSEGEVEFVLICGDLFDNADLETNLIEKTCRNIGKIPVPVYVLAGNHEWGGFKNILQTETFLKMKPANLVVLEPGLVKVNDTTEIFALPMRSKIVTDPFKDYENLPRTPGVKRVLAMHGSVDSVIDLAERGSGNSSAPIKKSELLELLNSGHVDYVALGDRHSTTDVESHPASLKPESSGRVFYSGAPEPTDFDEENQRNILFVDLDGNLPSVKAIEVGKWRFARVGKPKAPLDLESREDIDRLLNSWRDQEGQTVCVKLYCNKYYSYEDDLYFKTRIADFDLNDFAFFQESRNKAEFVPKIHFDFNDPNPLGLTGFLLDTFSELRQKVAIGDDTAARALELFVKFGSKK